MPRHGHFSVRPSGASRPRYCRHRGASQTLTSAFAENEPTCIHIFTRTWRTKILGARNHENRVPSTQIRSTLESLFGDRPRAAALTANVHFARLCVSGEGRSASSASTLGARQAQCLLGTLGIGCTVESTLPCSWMLMLLSSRFPSSSNLEALTTNPISPVLGLGPSDG